tara:strand:- start:949 stop:1494 length:546 start_codon:yes stop_codon:yes gene_type:complete
MENKKKKPEYEVIDDFVPDYTNQPIIKILSGRTFPWYLGNKVFTKENEHWNSQHFHMLYSNKNHSKSNFYSLVQPIINKLDPAIILRVKVNCTPWTKDIIKFPFHTDTNFKSKTCVYYVNDNNGYTYFEDGSKVYSKARRLIRFDSNIKHSGTTHTDAKHRFVININYIPKEMITYEKVQA